MSKKILIIEDEEYISGMYKIKFDKSGFDSIVADDGEKGVELALKERPDLILLDLILPKKDGFQVLKELKGDEKTKNIPVYVLSNLGQAGEISQGFSGGADGFMIKASLTPSQLVKNIEDIFSGKTVGVKRPAVIKDNIKAVEPPAAKENKQKDLGKILLFEDEEVLIDMYQIALKKAGFKVKIAKNGAWGLRLAEKEKFDIIVMDMMMPAMNGHEAIKNLKSNDKTKDIPVIILSNSAQDEDIDEAKKMGAVAYMLKSQITPAKLVSEIKKILKI